MANSFSAVSYAKDYEMSDGEKANINLKNNNDEMSAREKANINLKYNNLAFFKDELLEKSDLNITTNLMTRNDCYNTEHDINVRGIMVHSTACPGIMADEWYDLCNKSYEKGEIKREVCVHAFLDDKGVYQYLPWNHRAWHCGGKANSTHISFEICEPKGIVYDQETWEISSIDVEGTKNYFKKVWDNSVKLCVMLCKQFGLTEKDIICHCEGYELGIASKHDDVMHWWKYYDKDMDMFREDVRKALNEQLCENEENKCLESF